VIRNYGSAEPDPKKILTNPQHWFNDGPFPELGEKVHEKGTVQILAQLVQYEPSIKNRFRQEPFTVIKKNHITITYSTYENVSRHWHSLDASLHRKAVGGISFINRQKQFRDKSMHTVRKKFKIM
jgi:hypothetical protein